MMGGVIEPLVRFPASTRKEAQGAPSTRYMLSAIRYPLCAIRSTHYALFYRLHNTGVGPRFAPNCPQLPRASPRFASLELSRLCRRV